MKIKLPNIELVQEDEYSAICDFAIDKIRNPEMVKEDGTINLGKLKKLVITSQKG